MFNAPLIDRLRDRSARVAVLGQGYVGLVLAMGASAAGFPVVGLEPDASRHASLLDGHSYIEDVTDDDIRAAFASGYVPTNDPLFIAGFDVAVITVPTPLREGAPDLGFVEKAASQVGALLRPDTLVVLESTTYPGTTEELVRPILEEASGLVAGRHFLLGYSPERIDPGNVEWRLANTPKVVSGIDTASLDAVQAFYGAFVDELVPVGNPAEAELAKLLENTFRHVNIALVNELARFANELGIDIGSAIDAAASKPFGFMPFRPGPGVGGHCLPVDPSYLSWRVRHRLGKSFHFVELANEVNRDMPAYVVARTQALLNDFERPVKGSHIIVLGLAYKPGTSDARETPSLGVIEGLRRLGARLTVVDPHVAASRATPPELVASVSPDLVAAADLVLLLTDHDAFDYETIALEARVVFDTRGRLRGSGYPNVVQL